MRNLGRVSAIIAAVILVLACLLGCGAPAVASTASTGATQTVATASTASSVATSGTATVSNSGSAATPDAASFTEWDEALYPDYVRIVSEPVTIDEDVAAGSIVNSPLDSLGRSGRAIARIDYSLIEASAGWRSSFASDVDARLAGWGHNGKCSIELPNAKTYNGYFWNRSHPIADSLGGYNQETGKTEVENLITGTRMQNVGANDGNGGMAHFETRKLDYIKANPDVSVWYSATPLYNGDELIPRSVYVQALSSDGGLDMQGEVFNCAKGYSIDYSTGVFRKT